MSKTRQLLESPMSNVLINKYFNGDANIKTLSQISNMKSLDELMEDYEHVIIFMALQGETTGHWICLFINSENLYYFDSYGREPLQTIKKLIKLGHPTYGQNFNLLELIKNSEYKDNFYYNTIQYQADGAEIAVCGRYVSSVCILNILFKEKGEPFDFFIFYNLMNDWSKRMGNKSYDEVIIYFIDKF